MIGLRRVGEIFSAVAAVGGSLFGLFFALIAAGLTCDESCDDNSALWQDDPSAWQWDGQLVLAGVASAIAVYALVRAIRRRSFVPVLIASAATWAAWWAWLT